MTTALVPYRTRREIIIPQPQQADGATIGELCQQFLESKRTLMEAGERSEQQIYHDGRTVTQVLEFFGRHTLLEDLRPLDFMRFRASFPKTWGVNTVGNVIGRTRALFNFAYNSDLVRVPIRFGPDFKKPSARQYRKAKRERPLLMFEREEILALIDAASVALRPLILMGINCGFNISDCGQLPFGAISLERGWHWFARPKTEVDRRCPLWPETIDAIERWLRERPRPARPQFEERVFLTSIGTSWGEGEAHPPLTKKLKRLMHDVGINRRGLAFYGFRRSFETFAAGCRDQVAIDHIMGHTPNADDMSAIYRLRIGDDQLMGVSNYVREWLFGDNPLPTNPEQVAALEICQEWDAKETLTGADIQAAIDRLRVTQTALARGIGRNAQWVNAICRGRQPFGKPTDAALRRFFQQVAEGRIPTPRPSDGESLPEERLCDAPISEEARGALQEVPFTAAELAILVESLAELGITQTRLAHEWGIKLPFYFKLRNGKKPIPPHSAARLRYLFGVGPKPPAPPAPEESITPEPGSIPLPPWILALFDRPKFGPTELRILLRYLKDHLGINARQLDRWLGLRLDHLSNVISCDGYRRRAIPVPALRRLFVKGGAPC